MTNNTFTIPNLDVNTAFVRTGDEYGRTPLYVASLLERGIRVLIYVGENDWICNWVGNENWVMQLDWSGAKAFREGKKGEWSVDGKEVGQLRTSGGLTFATIRGAGHMVPYDKPKEALSMVQTWMRGDDF